jgi:hypothetical protein
MRLAMDRTPLRAKIPRTIFQISCDQTGRWHAVRSDRLVGGTFFERDAAMRFARRETRPGTMLLLVMKQPPRRVDVPNVQSAMRQVAK